MKKLILLCFFFCSFVIGQEVLISENFADGIPTDWKVESTNNKRSWMHKTYKGQHYINMSAFGGRGKPGYKVKTALHSPLIQPTDKICKLRFVFADAFENGQPLQVQISNEAYRPMRSLSDSAWKGLVNNSGSYDNHYENTEWITLPQVQEPYRISFVYNSEQEDRIVTTLIQLSEVDVWCE